MALDFYFKPPQVGERQDKLKDKEAQTGRGLDLSPPQESRFGTGCLCGPPPRLPWLCHDAPVPSKEHLLSSVWRCPRMQLGSEF